MNRIGFSIFVCVALFIGCTNAPSVSSPVNITKYGAGSGEEESSSTTNKAVAPLAIQKVRDEEILAQASAYESDFDRALDERDYQAAIAAFESISRLINGIPEGLTKLAELRGKIGGSLDSIRFETVSSPAETVAGTAFKKDFSVKIYTEEQDEKRPLAGLECTVLYPSTDANGSKTMMAENRVSSDEGIVSFAAPVPAHSGKDALVIAATLTTNDSILREAFTARKEKGQLAVTFPHLVSSNARRLATTISILDFDQNGKAIISNNVSSTSLLKPLVQKGFTRIGMAEFPNQLTSGDEAALIKAAKAQFGSGVQRFIYGTTRVESLSQTPEGLWACTIVARICVRDLSQDTVIYRTELSDTETGKNEFAAIDIARKKLAGIILVQDLYYNM